MKRSALLTAGHRVRRTGVVLLATLITAAIRCRSRRDPVVAMCSLTTADEQRFNERCQLIALTPEGVGQ